MAAPSVMVGSMLSLIMPSKGEPFRNDCPTIDLFPPGDVALVVEGGADAMHEERPVTPALDVVLARPHDLDRAFVLRRLQDLGGLARHVGVRGRPPAEAAAGEQRLDADLLRLEPEHLGGHCLIDRLNLRAEDQFGAAVGAADDAVVRLHRRVGEIGET